MNSCFTAGKRIGVWNCRAILWRQRETTVMQNWFQWLARMKCENSWLISLPIELQEVMQKWNSAILPRWCIILFANFGYIHSSPYRFGLNRHGWIDVLAISRRQQLFGRPNMTITYQSKVTSASSCAFGKLLGKWKGSIYKLVYKELVFYGFCYAVISLTYRQLLAPKEKRQVHHYSYLLFPWQ